MLQLEMERHGAVVVVAPVAGGDGCAVGRVFVVGLDLDGRELAARGVFNVVQAPAVSASDANAAISFHDRGRPMA